jgi:hypothetical protein
MYEDGEFDYGPLPLAELEYVVEHIDGVKFPRNLANACAALEARRRGATPEPPPILDQATDRKYTFWVQKFVGVYIAGYGLLGLLFEKIVLLGRHGVVELKGNQAYVASTAVIFLGAVAILAPRRAATVETLFPRVWWIYPAAIVIALTIMFAVRFTRGV